MRFTSGSKRLRQSFRLAEKPYPCSKRQAIGLFILTYTWTPSSFEPHKTLLYASQLQDSWKLGSSPTLVTLMIPSAVSLRCLFRFASTDASRSRLAVCKMY